MYKIKITTIFLLLVTTLYAKELEKITIQLDWLHQFQFAGYYVAKEKGFYEKESLDVSIKEYNSNFNIVNKILTTPNSYAVGKSSLIIDILDNKKIILLSAIYQNSPMVLISKKESNITSPSDLKNRSVMLTSDARSAASINAMIISQGLKLSDISFKNHSFDLEDLINGNTEAMGCYLSNEPYLLEKRGIKYNVLNPKDYGFDFYGGIFFTSQDELKNHSQRVRAVYKATMRGWEYAFNNIEETAKLIFDKYNTQNKTLEQLIYEGNLLKKLSKIDEGLLGDIEKKKIDEIKRLYILLGFGQYAKNRANVEDFIYDSSNIQYSKDQKNYIEQSKITLLSDNNFQPFAMMMNNELTGIELDYWNLLIKKLDFKNSNVEITTNIKESVERIKHNPNLIKYAFSKRVLQIKQY
ncbi:ABC transporter substrate-binding protein [Halarcobacter ebronensis]|uniref:Thiamine pyrimidine synthase n=1 Tax=Halarcobacter ebronensis TaxID=1462615 RepID=A0A4Q1AJ02_9BACT|nr:ABC transporter substrate-binding protein [Halarcobacter ebronensis]RXK01610.1 hypothetical protein CRV07_14875 [Halarcobacter ebronensis]